MYDYSKLLAHCRGPAQTRLVEAVIRSPSLEAAFREVGGDRRNHQKNLSLLKRRAAQEGYAPGHWEDGTAPGYGMAKVTIQRGADGEIERTWERQTPLERAAQTIAECIENFSPKPIPKIKSPPKTDKSLLTLYTLTDFHLGMYAYAKETGDDWDTDIASKVLTNAICEMAEKSPNSEIAILNIQGDYLHWDGLDALTPQNKHVLDADTRFDRMIELAIDLVTWATQILLKKHKRVKLIICEGNHDLAGSAWLRKTVKALFRQNPRVDVDDTAFPYYAHLHGQTMLGFHHGHKMKNKSLPALFASEPRYREMWGKATYTYIHTGHYHQSEQDMAEMGGAIVERHPTLASRDAHAARGGYISRRGARAITYHLEDGEVERVTVLPRVL